MFFHLTINNQHIMAVHEIVYISDSKPQKAL